MEKGSKIMLFLDSEGVSFPPVNLGNISTGKLHDRDRSIARGVRTE